MPGARIRPSLWLRALPELGIAAGSRVLTVGMAEEASVTAALVGRGAEVVVADWRASALRAAAEAGPPGARSWPWDGTEDGAAPEAPFDHALCDLARLPGREAFLLAIRFAVRHLRPGGQLLVRGGNTEGIGGALTRLQSWFPVTATLALGGRGRILACNQGGQSLPPPPEEDACTVELGGVRLELRRAAAVFNAGLPDAATHLLASAVAADGAAWQSHPESACDVGCGGGALGLALLGLGAGACTLLDDSLIATRAAAANAARNGAGDLAVPVAADATAGVPGGPFALVVCNPPFHTGPHEDRGLGEAVVRAAWEATTGRLYVVAPRFLRYERAVLELQECAANATFRVLRAVRGAGRRPSAAEGTEPAGPARSRRTPRRR
jgi:16S rRNA G1207 methylase RsmC